MITDMFCTLAEKCENYDFCINNEKLCIKKLKNEESCIKTTQKRGILYNK